MPNNKRKVYGEEDADGGDKIAPPCRVCGCRQRIIKRIISMPKAIEVSRACRNCGAESVDMRDLFACFHLIIGKTY